MNDTAGTDWGYVRDMVAKQVRIWPYWRTDGELGLLLQKVDKNGNPTITIGSCKASHANEYLGMMMRGLEVGFLIAVDVEASDKPYAGD